MKTLWDYAQEFKFEHVDQVGVVVILNTAAWGESGELKEGPRPSDAAMEEAIERMKKRFGL